MPLTVPPDLVVAARNGDPGSLERLLETAWPHAFRIARSVVLDDDAAQDAAQEACAIVYRTIATLRAPDAFRAWFYRIVVREASAMLHRSRMREPLEATRDDDGESLAGSLDMQSALAKLQPKQRAVLTLRYYADLTSKEMGVALGMPSATVRFHLARALRRMRELLRERGDTTVYTHSEAPL